jgi:hypothetical protein
MEKLYRTLADNPWSDADREHSLARLAELAPEVEAAERERAALAGSPPLKARAGRPPMYGPDHFAKVAAVYTTAHRAGKHPTKAVADHFHVARSTAAKWVARCRSPKLGLLGDTVKRKAGGIMPPDKEG